MKKWQWMTKQREVDIGKEDSEKGWINKNSEADRGREESDKGSRQKEKG